MTKGAMGSFDRFVREIHRRSLWQVLGIYLVGSWIALQVVDVLANNFGLPEWFPPFALALLVIGLPVVLATAFIQKGLLPHETTDAVSGEAAPALGDEAGHRRLFTWRNAIAGGVAAFGLWGVVATAWLLFGPGTALPPLAGTDAVDRLSIAVLPFASVRTDAESESFTSGIHDDILTHLSKISALKVISRTSVVRYRETEKSIREIAEELGVATVLEGRVQRAGDRVRINAQLIDAQSDEHLWAETYDRELTAASIFAIQTDLAKNIAGALQATLAPETAAEIERKPTESLEAYDLYTRGRYLYNTRGFSRTGLESAADLFRQAIAADPEYATAYGALAAAYLQLWGNGYLPETEALPQARTAAEKALELEPTLAEAHSALGWVLQAELRFNEAEREYRRALELNPGSAWSHYQYSRLLRSLGRHEESVSEVRRAVELDPLVLRYRFGLLSALGFAREYEATIAEAQRLIEIEPDNPDAFYFLSLAFGMTGRYEDAVGAASHAVELNPEDPYYPAALAWAHALAGERAPALAALERARGLGAPLKELALVYGALGNLDEAFAYLDRAYAEEPGSLGNINSDPTADPLRKDPRWGELLKKLGLE